MNGSPENTSESDLDSGFGERHRTPIDRAIELFYKDAVRTDERLEIDCNMEWLDKPTNEQAGGRVLHKYKTTFSKMRGILNGKPAKFAWIEPEEMKVQVYYAVDGGPMWHVPDINLKIVNGEICFENRLIRGWNSFILVGLQFDEGQIKYMPDNFSGQRTVQKTYNTHFVFKHSSASIWGKVASNEHNPEFVDKPV